MDTQLLIAMVVSPVASLVVVSLGVVVNYRSGKARADEIKMDLTAQTTAMKLDLAAAIRETKTDLMVNLSQFRNDVTGNMSQLRNDVTSGLLRSETASGTIRTDLKEFFRLELRAAMADIRTSIAEKQTKAIGDEKFMASGSMKERSE